MEEEDLAVSHGDITGGATVTKVVLHRLLQAARDKGRKVENRRKGEHNNWYIDDRLFAGECASGRYRSRYIVIKI